MIDQKPNEPKPSEKTIKVEIKRDYWPQSGGERIKAGAVVELPEKEAKHLVNLEAAKFPKE